MKKIILLMLLMVTTNIFSQEVNDDYFQDDLTFENPYRTNDSIQEQEELNYQYNEPNEYFLTEEEVYNAETEYNE
jgi:hypothetical protein